VISIWNLLLITGITIYIAFMYQSTGMMLLFFMEATLFVVASVSLLVRCSRVRGYMEVPVGIAERGGEGMIKLVMENRGLLPINKIRALVVVNDMMRGKKKRYWMTMPAVPRGDSVFMKNLFFYGTGNYEIYLRKLRIYDITGAFCYNIRMQKQGTIQVMPKIFDVPVRLTRATRSFYGDADVYDENHPGQDKSEMFQVREYRAGDRLQNVHWKLTAKQEELVVKEYSLPKACPVMLILSYGARKKKQLLRFMETVASLSFSIMDAGCPHYVVWYDGMEQDVMRIRVDDEESLFYMIGVLMKIHWVRCKEDITQLYREKYRQDPYVWTLTLDEKLQLYKEKELLVKYSARKTESSLGQTELLI